jgi:hypothetical protein
VAEAQLLLGRLVLLFARRDAGVLSFTGDVLKFPVFTDGGSWI